VQFSQSDDATKLTSEYPESARQEEDAPSWEVIKPATCRRHYPSLRKGSAKKSSAGVDSRKIAERSHDDGVFFALKRYKGQGCGRISRGGPAVDGSPDLTSHSLATFASNEQRRVLRRLRAASRRRAGPPLNFPRSLPRIRSGVKSQQELWSPRSHLAQNPNGMSKYYFEQPLVTEFVFCVESLLDDIRHA